MQLRRPRRKVLREQSKPDKPVPLRLSWGERYRRALRRGYDHGYAAYLADKH